MSIGAINHGYNYQNTYNSRTVYMPAPVCKSKMRDLGDECILTEKNDGDNDVYRNAYTGATGSGFRTGFNCGFVDLSSKG